MVSYERFHELFEYFPDTGVVIAKVGFPRRKKGSVVGYTHTSSMDGRKDLRLRVDGTPYLLHRVIWYMQTGSWPDIIDHINGDATDNRWENLRNVSNEESQKNLARQARNKTGITGVRLLRGSYVACISDKNEQISLYCGKDFFEACCRRKSAENAYGYHANHGRRMKNTRAML